MSTSFDFQDVKEADPAPSRKIAMATKVGKVIASQFLKSQPLMLLLAGLGNLAGGTVIFLAIWTVAFVPEFRANRENNAGLVKIGQSMEAASRSNEQTAQAMKETARINEYIINRLERIVDQLEK